MENNIYNFNQYGKNYLDKTKRLEKQTMEYLREADQRQKEAEEQRIAKENNAALSGARFAYASSYAKQKDRIKNLQETVQYNEKASLAGMTEMVSTIVKKALLVDETEYAKLNENYETELHETVRNFLANASINETISNPDTLEIMEYVQSVLPDVKTGKYLTEEQIASVVKTQTPKDIEESINNLSGDIASRVARLVEDESKDAKKINDDIEKAGGKKAVKAEEKVDEAAAVTPEQLLNALNNGEIKPEDIETMYKDGDISEEVYNQVGEVLKDAVENEDIPAENNDQVAGKNIHIGPDGTTIISMPNGALSLNSSFHIG